MLEQESNRWANTSRQTGDQIKEVRRQLQKLRDRDDRDGGASPDLAKIARTPAELDGFWGLRRAVFCEEQKIFQGTDEDECDHTMIPIVSLSLVMGMEDEVAGVVRIDEQEPGVWWESRLAVRRDYRSLRRLSRSVPVRNRQPGSYGGRSPLRCAPCHPWSAPDPCESPS